MTYLSIGQAAKFKNCSRPTIYAWVRDQSIDSEVFAGKTHVIYNEKLIEIKKKTHIRLSATSNTTKTPLPAELLTS